MPASPRPDLVAGKAWRGDLPQAALPQPCPSESWCARPTCGASPRRACARDPRAMARGQALGLLHPLPGRHPQRPGLERRAARRTDQHHVGRAPRSRPGRSSRPPRRLGARQPEPARQEAQIARRNGRPSAATRSTASWASPPRGGTGRALLTVANACSALGEHRLPPAARSRSRFRRGCSGKCGRSSPSDQAWRAACRRRSPAMVPGPIGCRWRGRSIPSAPATRFRTRRSPCRRSRSRGRGRDHGRAPAARPP